MQLFGGMKLTPIQRPPHWLGSCAATAGSLCAHINTNTYLPCSTWLEFRRFSEPALKGFCRPAWAIGLREIESISQSMWALWAFIFLTPHIYMVHFARSTIALTQVNDFLYHCERCEMKTFRRPCTYFHTIVTWAENNIVIIVLNCLFSVHCHLNYASIWSFLR